MHKNVPVDLFVVSLFECPKKSFSTKNLTLKLYIGPTIDKCLGKSLTIYEEWKRYTALWKRDIRNLMTFHQIYVRVWGTFYLALFTSLKILQEMLYSVYLYQECVKSGLRSTQSWGRPFCNIKNFSKKPYIRYTLHPEIVSSESRNSGKGFVGEETHLLLKCSV